MTSRTAPRRLATPLPIRVDTDAHGVPTRIDGREVDGIRESWLVEDRWWAQPIRRRYWEVVTADGRNLVLFRDLVAGAWFRQSAL